MKAKIDDEYKKYEELCNSLENVTFLGIIIEEIGSSKSKTEFYLAELEERDVLCYACHQKRDCIKTIVGWQPYTPLNVVKALIEAAWNRSK